MAACGRAAWDAAAAHGAAPQKRETTGSLRHHEIILTVAMAAIPLAWGQPNPGVTLLHEFPATPADGANPYGGVVFGSNGVIYGTTDAGGGPQNNGIVYSLTPPASPGGSWTQAILWSPTYGQGINPYATPAIGANGALYGTLFGGANGGNGSVFALQPPTSPSGTWTAQVLHRFSGSPDGASPTSGVAIGPGGMLYGTTSEGGKSNAGAVYSVQLPATPGGSVTEAVLYSFTGGADGGNPFGPVLPGAGGVLYGTTRFGGAADYGCVFQLTPPAMAGGSWTEQVLYSFSGSPDAYPIGGVIAGANGVLYGATFGMPQSGNNYGNVYQLAPAAGGGTWVYSNIHSFTSQVTDAADPVGVALGPNGVLYGAAHSGRTPIFALTPPGTPGRPWTLTPLGQIKSSYAPLTVGPDGALYGVSFGKFGLRGEGGSVFRVSLQ